MSWQRVRGHELLVRSFDQIVGRGRLAHAYLFTGPVGVGKRLFAGELAKSLLCESPSGTRLEACDRCPACQLVEAGTHPDFFTVGRPEEVLEVPIAVVRELCRSLALKPARGRHKIAILDDADDLNEEAANCFLKTLEEPPPHSVLILVGTSAERQLATIVSRCQVIGFAPLAQPLVTELLRAQGVEDSSMVERLARLGGGSPGLARALADPALWEFRRTLLEGLIAAQPDSVRLAQEYVQFLEEAGKETGAQRRRAALVLRLLIEFLDDVLRLSVGGTPRLAEPDDLELLRKVAKRVDADRVLELLEHCLESDLQIDRRAQVVLLVEALLDVLGQKLGDPGALTRVAGPR